MRGLRGKISFSVILRKGTSFRRYALYTKDITIHTRTPIVRQARSGNVARGRNIVDGRAHQSTRAPLPREVTFTGIEIDIEDRGAGMKDAKGVLLGYTRVSITINQRLDNCEVAAPIAIEHETTNVMLDPY